jgi:hypothetical protein
MGSHWAQHLGQKMVQSLVHWKVLMMGQKMGHWTEQKKALN